MNFPVMSHGQRDSADEIKLRILRWGHDLGLSERAQCDHEGPYEGKRKAGEVHQERVQDYAAGSEEPRQLTGQGDAFSPEPPAAGPAHAFRTPDLRNCRTSFYHFTPLSLWWFVLAGTGN